MPSNLRMKDLRALKGDKLAEKVTDLRKELMKLQTQVSSGTPPESPGKIRAIKRALARVKTLHSQDSMKTDGGDKE